MFALLHIGVTIMEYNAKQFSTAYNTPLGQSIWILLNHNDQLIRMETAIYLRRPAIEAIQNVLLESFGDEVRDDFVKRMIGNMTRQILEARGYKHISTGARLLNQELFSTGSKYSK